MPANFIVQLLIGVAMSVIGYMLMPKPKQQEPATLDDFKEPTADAGRPIPVVFGSMTVSDVNILWWGDKSRRQRPANEDSKK